MSVSWAVILGFAVVVAIGLVVRGIKAMGPGGSGALWAFLSAAAIVVFNIGISGGQRSPQRGNSNV